MQPNNNKIALNFLEIIPKAFDVTFYWRKVDLIPDEEQKNYYQRNLKETDQSEKAEKFAIVFEEKEGFNKKVVASDFNIDITKTFLLNGLKTEVIKKNIKTYPTDKGKYHRFYFPLKTHKEGVESIWIEPYFLKQTNSYGFLVDFKFWVDIDYKKAIKGSVDKRILQLSGTLDNKGFANKSFYQFRYEKLQIFLGQYLSFFKNFTIGDISFTISEKLCELTAHSLNPKTYQFFENKESNSPFMGLMQYPPYQKADKQTSFLFVFKENDRNIAINLLNGLKGITSPSTFEGIEKMFRIPFNNDCIKGEKVSELSFDILTKIADDILAEKEKGLNILPVILTNSKTTEIDDKLYFTIKHIFTKRDIPCQVVTKDLIINANSLKYSLSNIALQIFAKSGGRPWKVKPAIKECLIIGIGNKNKEIIITDENGNKIKKIEKFLTYSVLTDSSGIFKEIQILSETDNEDDYYRSLINKLKAIILQAVEEGNKDIVVHSPFRISKPKVWDVLFKNLPGNLNLSILLINNEHKYFGYDFSKNSLVPFESSFINLSEREYLVWFEGLQYHNTTISKLISGPIYIDFWHSNNQELLHNSNYRKNLLQDCINLSGANWRGFKAKQLPVSIFYCQKIADFLKKFEDYEFEHIEFENFKPWFL